jgi:hypothetical protein
MKHLFQTIIVLLFTYNAVAQDYILENKYSRIKISDNRITSLFDKTRNVEHSAGKDALKTMLKIQLVEDITALNEIDIKLMNVKASQNKNSISFEFKHDLVEGQAKISLIDTSGELIFAISAKPKNSKHAIARIDFPCFETPSFSNNIEKFCLTPYREGRLTPISLVLSGGNEGNNFFTYPKFLFSQFIGCLGDKAGFMLWADDNEGFTKEFGRIYQKDISQFAVRHFRQYEYGKEQKLSYKSRITFTGSQWYDMADRYRTWSDDQPWSKVKLKDRTDIPDILMKNTPIILSGEIEQEDLTKTTRKLKSWQDQFKTPIIYRPLGWEKHGKWNGIDYFPASIGDDKFKGLAKSLKDENIMIGGFISGFAWVTKDEAMKTYFEENKGEELCETTRQGKLKSPVRVCRGSEFGKNFLQNTASSMFDLGMTIIHVDVDYGTYQFSSEACFNKDHGHPLPCGLWEIEITRKALQEIKQEARNRGLKDFFLSKEYFTELFIPDIHSFQARFFYTLSEPFHVPLAQYLFHDYVFTAFGLSNANDNSNITPLMLIYGQVPSMAFWNKALGLPTVENAPQSILLTDYFEAMKSHAKIFLSFGKMRKPLITDAPFEEKMIKEANVTKVEGGMQKIVFDKPLIEKTPLVMQSSWEDEKGNTGVFAVNNLKTNQLVTVCAPGNGVYEAAFYIGADKIKTENVANGTKLAWDIPSGRFCSIVFRKK